jgi:hypothetical protein
MFWVFAAYFLDEAFIMFTIQATNTTITTTAVKASVATTMISLSAIMVLTVWHDVDYQIVAVYHSYLPKLAVETVDVEPGSELLDTMLAERQSASVAWTGWPRKSAVAILVSIVIYLLSMLLGTAAPESLYDDDGNDSFAMLALRAAALAMLIGGSCTFFFNNVSWRRLKHTYTSPQVGIAPCLPLSPPLTVKHPLLLVLLLLLLLLPPSTRECFGSFTQSSSPAQAFSVRS